MSDWTEEHTKHLKLINEYFISKNSTKYYNGTLEHGGHLYDMSVLQLVDNAIDEAIDQFVYLVTLREKLNKESL